MSLAKPCIYYILYTLDKYAIKHSTNLFNLTCTKYKDNQFLLFQRP